MSIDSHVDNVAMYYDSIVNAMAAVRGCQLPHHLILMRSVSEALHGSSRNVSFNVCLAVGRFVRWTFRPLIKTILDTNLYDTPSIRLFVNNVRTIRPF